MFLHLGGDTVVSSQEVIGIFDMENTTVSAVTRKFLACSEKQGHVKNVSYELPRSFIVCGENKSCRTGRFHVYISQISPSTLKKRSGFMRELGQMEP